MEQTGRSIRLDRLSLCSTSVIFDKFGQAFIAMEPNMNMSLLL
jgi:hypothetical protein